MLTSTTRSSGRIIPRSASSGSAASVAAPSGDQANRRSRHSSRITARMASSETETAQPPVARMIRKTLMCPTFCATFNPVAIVRPGGPRFDVGRSGLERADDRRAGRALDADHPGPIGPDQAERLELVERLGHADHSGSAPGRIDDHVGKLPAPVDQALAGRLGHLQSQRLLPLGAPARLLERGDVEIAPRNVFFADALGAVDDRPGDEVQLDEVGIEPGVGGHFAQHRQVGVGRHDDDRLDPRRHGILGQRIAGVSLGRNRQPVQAERPGHRDRHGHAPVLEGKRGIGPEAGSSASPHP